MGDVGDSLKAGLTGGLVGMAKTPGFLDVLGSLSPLAGIVSGRGVFGAATRDKSEKEKAKEAADKIAKEAASAEPTGAKRGGMIKKKPMKKMAKGGSVSSASKRGDGCAAKGKTKGKFV